MGINFLMLSHLRYKLYFSCYGLLCLVLLWRKDMRFYWFFIGFFVSVCSYADGSSGYVPLSAPIQIIDDGDAPRAFVYDVVVNDDKCSKKYPVILLDSSRFLAREFYSTILMAKAANKRVNLATKGCWMGQYPIVFSIYVE